MNAANENLHFFAPLLMWLSVALISIGLLQNLIQLLQIWPAMREWRAQNRASESESNWQLLTSEELPALTVIVTAFNESKTICNSLESVLSPNYPSLQVIVVNDGSTDDTLEQLIQKYGLIQGSAPKQTALHHKPILAIYSSRHYPRLKVIDKINGGNKADAANAGLAVTKTPLVCITDGDSFVDVNALINAARPFAEEPDEMVAVGGAMRLCENMHYENGKLKIVQKLSNPLILFQTVEYLRAFHLARLAWSRWNSMGLISGAFGVYRLDILIDIGGFDPKSIGEDYDLTMRIHRVLSDKGQPYQMRFVPETLCYTQPPSDVGSLLNQRRRWQRGALEVFASQKSMMGRARYRGVGNLYLPYALLTDIIGPFSEAIGWILLPIFYVLGVLSGQLLLAVFLAICGLSVANTLFALAVRDMQEKGAQPLAPFPLIIIAAFFEAVIYRQLISYSRIRGTIDHFSGVTGWGHVKRR